MCTKNDDIGCPFCFPAFYHPLFTLIPLKIPIPLVTFLSLLAQISSRWHLVKTLIFVAQSSAFLKYEIDVKLLETSAEKLGVCTCHFGMATFKRPTIERVCHF